jgi:hypothetical protein
MCVFAFNDKLGSITLRGIPTRLVELNVALQQSGIKFEFVKDSELTVLIALSSLVE